MYGTPQHAYAIIPPSRNYSHLETITYSSANGSVAYSIADSAPSFGYALPIPLLTPREEYHSPASWKRYQQSEQQYHLSTPHQEYHFTPDLFLKPGKEGKFVGKAEDIKEFIEDAFEKVFHIPFPIDIKISVCDLAQFRKIAPHPSTIGLSINRRKEGLLSEIFVLNDSLARVMLTIGHELGHVLTQTLDNPHDEEAKAYAFSLVWMKAIREFDIAGLADAFVMENPAKNGLHNVAFQFVEKVRQQGVDVWGLYVGLLRGEYSFQEELALT